MSRSAADLLTSAYGVDRSRLDVIPHGVPELPLVDSGHGQAGLRPRGSRGHPELRPARPGQGLRARDRRAARRWSRRTRSVLYVIVGATHPDLLRSEGEAYREAPRRHGRPGWGSSDHVRFVDRYVGRAELTQWLEAADVFVTPYPEPRPDRVRDAVLRDGRRPRDRVDAVRLRDASSSPTAAASSCAPALRRRRWRPR